MPVYKCSCGDEGAASICGYMEYARKNKGEKYQIRKMLCKACNGKGNITECYLPIQFAVKTVTKNRNDFKNVFAQREKGLIFRNYVVSGIIQFHEQTKHFRSIKMMGAEKAKILDR